MAACDNDWTILLTTLYAQFDNHYPSHPWLQFSLSNPVIYPKVTHREPLPNVKLIFTDGSKQGIGAIVTKDKNWTFLFPSSSPQETELLAGTKAFQMFDQEPFNLLSDSKYVVQAVSVIENVGTINVRSTIAKALQEIQTLIWDRKVPFYIGHIRAHTNLPGPLSEGN